MDKVNYYLESLKTLEKLPDGKKPKLLLHACCGPCSCFPLTFLCPHFDVTIYYANSNIYPPAEYEHRRDELIKLLANLEKDYGFHVDLILPPYENESFTKTLSPYADAREGGQRCFLCYRLRMEEAYSYAEAHGFDYFTTVMTVSRQKNSQILNQIGAELEPLHPKTKYFYSDFKKQGGIEKGKEIRLRYDLYNQQYCGCLYSYQKMLEKIEEEKQKSENNF